jgi:quercetin dioxygenase-like cupin family protein
MKHFAALLALGIATAVIAADAEKPQLTVMRLADRPTIEGPAANFTGKAKIDRQVRPEDSRPLGSMVSFEPGARTAWHTHPLGQTLHVISGVGRVQAKGGPIREIKAGDTVWIPPGEKHWHGAGPNTGMVHIAMQEALDGKHVEWMEYVTDEEYSQPVGG